MRVYANKDGELLALLHDRDKRALPMGAAKVFEFDEDTNPVPAAAVRHRPSDCRIDDERGLLLDGNPLKIEDDSPRRAAEKRIDRYMSAIDEDSSLSPELRAMIRLLAEHADLVPRPFMQSPGEEAPHGA